MIYLEIIIGIVLGIILFFISKQNIKVLKNLANNKKELENVENKNKDLKNENKFLENLQEKEHNKLSQLKKDLSDHAEAESKIVKLEYEKKVKELKEKYSTEQEEYKEAIELLNQSYAQLQDDILHNLEEEQGKLDRIKELRIAAQEAITREKEIKENKDFYSLNISLVDKADIKTLEEVKKDLSRPRILSMLIWQTYFKQIMNDLCNNVLGTNTITGIYKITNLKTNECYIGQAVDVAKRWKDHAKHGLGIDTPKNNKLYNAMADYGLWNFSWELIEKCSRDLLNEKEKYYIDLYMSKDYGYNTMKGISKNGTK